MGFAGRRAADLNSVYEGTTGAARVSASRELLRELTTALGSTGLGVAARLPGLMAAIDQHAAAVRDSVGDGRTAPGPVALAGYAEGLIHAAREAGWRLPVVSGIDWIRADWRVLRLVAICALAENA
jgi:Family of unknown function (DUF6401)